MNKKLIKKQQLVVFTAAVILLSVFFSYRVQAESDSNIKKILIINSYHEGFAWTRDETDAIIRILNNSSEDYSISVEYMDWMNYPANQNLSHLADYFKYKYRDQHIDTVIAADDIAVQFALKNRAEIFSNAPVVFCGINQNNVNRITGEYGRLTGVIEEIDPTETINLALNINPSLKKVYVLFDNTESGYSAGNLVMDKINSMNRGLKTVPLNNLSYDELIKSVKSYENDSIILLVSYNSDVNGRILDFKSASKEISKNSSVPVFHLNEIGLRRGALGGNLMSGRLQGEKAAQLAIRILNGENPDSIPFLSIKANRNAVDYKQLQRFNIPLDKIPKNYELINKPVTFFDTYRMLVLTALWIFLSLVVFIGILLFYIKKMNKMEKELEIRHEELSQIYEELTASDEELKQQYNELTSLEESLAASEERFRVATDGANAIIWDLDMLTMKYSFSDRWYELLGYEKDEIDEANGGWRTIIHPDDSTNAELKRNAHLDGKTSFYDCEYRVKNKKGDYIWFNVRGQVLKDLKGNNIRFAGSMIDISDRKDYEVKLQSSYQELEATYEELAATQDELQTQYDEILKNHEKLKATEERLAYLAYHDVLTGLPNKLSLYEKSDKNALIFSDSKAALLFIDMDNFKFVNDTMGHASGDQLIIKVSERLSSLLKEGCNLYRLSGDEFIIIIHGIQGKADAEIFASHILAGFKEEIRVQESELHISLSIGIAMSPEHGQKIEELLKNADISMYKSKEAGKNKYTVYDISMNEVFVERVNIEKYLYTALGKNEFELYYQPQLDISTRKITGFEALLRWNSPELGFVSPSKFINVAEDTHIIIQLGGWVLRNACDFIKKLHQEGNTDLYVSVNISILQLLQTEFNDMVIDILEYYELRPESLELEITESILVESFDAICRKLESLRDKGVRIALDDFGKGYSSLNYLRQLPISTLKIDKSFIDNISLKNESETLTGHIIAIGKSMGMSVVAEGVETQEQLDYLIRHGCNKIQGHLFSEAVTESELVRLLRSQLNN